MPCIRMKNALTMRGQRMSRAPQKAIVHHTFHVQTNESLVVASLHLQQRNDDNEMKRETRKKIQKYYIVIASQTSMHENVNCVVLMSAPDHLSSYLICTSKLKFFSGRLLFVVHTQTHCDCTTLYVLMCFDLSLRYEWQTQVTARKV